MYTKKEKGCVIMKIQAVVIDGFKNLSNVRITFDKITALVALNNFGKSNVLSGIDFGLAFIKASDEDKKEMMANTNLIPINQCMQGRNYKFEVEVLTEDAGQEYRVQYGYEFAWQCDEDEVPEIIREYLKIKLDEEVVDPDDVEMLEDLIVAAVNEVLEKVDEASAAAMSKFTGGMGGGMPGLF